MLGEDHDMLCLDDVRRKRAEILRIAATHGAHDVLLFGSIVRGQGEEGSDLDILVHMDDDRSLLDQIALIRELEELLDCPVDVVTDEALHTVVRDRVLSEGVAL